MAQDPAVALRPEYLEWLRGLDAERRYGERDRRGSANLIGEGAGARAARSIGAGATVSIARPLIEGSSRRGDGRPSYGLEVFYTDGPIGMGSDHVELDCHGMDNTHLDALNHLAIDGRWYGGWAVEEADPPSVDDVSGEGIFTRAVHLDIAALRGTPWVDPDRPVTGDDLEAAASASGADLEPGDALLVDMGRDRWEAAGRPGAPTPLPGIGGDGARWIAEHEIGLLCWDFLDAVHPSEPVAPVHMLNWALGLLLCDNCDFSRLRAQMTGRSTAALVIAPLPMRGATGCNVNPLLIL